MMNKDNFTIGVHRHPHPPTFFFFSITLIFILAPGHAPPFSYGILSLSFRSWGLF